VAVRKVRQAPTRPNGEPAALPIGRAPLAADLGRIVRFHAQDGLQLAARVFDAEHGTRRLPLLCLPGLSRNSRDFLRLGQYVSRHPVSPRRVVALDYRGRGLSASDPNWRNYTPLVEARDAFTAATVLGIERAILLGTSRGGIITMLVGALRPGLIEGAILNDIGPVIEGTGLVRIKRYLSTQPALRDWPEAVGWLRDVAAGPFPILDDDDWRASAEAIFRESPRGIIPDFDPNLVRVVQQIDFSERIPVLWPQFDSLKRIPLLAVRGDNSDILSARTLDAMAERHPRFERMIVRGQGHAPLLRDTASLDRILAFADRCEREAPQAS
jgi:pimeloyl-ACP methyl ester carboxylesterase